MDKELKAEEREEVEQFCKQVEQDKQSTKGFLLSKERAGMIVRALRASRAQQVGRPTDAEIETKAWEHASAYTSEATEARFSYERGAKWVRSLLSNKEEL